MASGVWLRKLAWNLPWLVRYPFWRANEFIGRLRDGSGAGHLVFVVANHFEPSYNEEPNAAGGFGIELSADQQLRRLEDWYTKARAIGEAVRDHDGTPFRHTNFYPIEQYDRTLVNRLAEMQKEGFGEVEIHLHHGVDAPDTADTLRRTLLEGRDVLAGEHKCLSRGEHDATPQYAFVHGNFALGNSKGGRCCGVDSELQILADTGCYADLTMPSAPDRSQVPRINALYQCGRPLSEPRPHRSGPSLRCGAPPSLPMIFDGPLTIDWHGRRDGLPFPRIDNGAVTARYPADAARLGRWRGARIGVIGRPDWVFIKLYCHGFFDYDQDATIGKAMRVFLQEMLEFAERTGEFRVHFACAREAFNIVIAAVDGHAGNPHDYRDYRLRQIMQTP